MQYPPIVNSTRRVSLFRADSVRISEARAASTFTLSRLRNSLRGKLRPVSTALAGAFGTWLCLRFACQLDWNQVLRDARHAGPCVVLLVLAPVVGNFVHMLGWRGLLPVAARPRLTRAFAIFLTAQAGNEVGSGVLGESFKVSFLSSAQRAAALRAVVLDNLTALVALAAVVLSIGSALGGRLIERFLPLPVAFGALGFTLLGGAALAKRAFATTGSANLWAAFAAHYLGKLWIVADFALWLWLVAQAHWHSSALLGLVTTVASVIGAPIPGQLGVVEAALGGSAAWVGLGASTLLSVAVLRRARGLLWIALGGVLLWRLRVGAKHTRHDLAAAISDCP